MDPIRVVIADDHRGRAGLRLLLDAEEALHVVAEAGEIDNARRMVRFHRPDVLVLDLNMPGGDSLPAIPELAEHTAVVVLTMQNDPAFARRALQDGARATCSRRPPTPSSSRRSRPPPRAARTSTPSSARGWPPRRPSRPARPTTSPSASSRSCG